MQKKLQILFDEFIYEAEYVRKVSPATIKGYTTSFELFLKLSPSVSLDTLAASTVIQFFKELQVRKRVVGKGRIKTGIKKSTVATYWCKLNAFFRWLVLKGYIQQSPFHGMKYTAPLYEDKKYLKKEEIEKILTAIYRYQTTNLLLFKRNLLLFNMALFCGLRKEELLLLQLRDIGIERKELTIRGETSKSRTTRHLPLHQSTVLYLKDYLKERKSYTTPLLFVSSTKDEGLTFDGLKHLVQRLNDLSGVSFHLHQLRHTFAVNFLKATNNLYKLKELLGHKDIRVTMTYLRCMPASEFSVDVELLNIDTFL